MLVTGVTVCLVGFSRPLLAHWMGRGFDGSVAPVWVLALVGLVVVTHASASSILLASGRQRIVASVWILEATANLALSLMFVRPFGAVGVALGTALPILLGHTVARTLAACRRVDL